MSGGNKIPAGEAQRNFPVLRGHAPHPLPPPAHILLGKRGRRWRGRGKTILYISFQRGISSPFGTPTGRKMRGEFFFVVIGTFKGSPLSHGCAVTAPPMGEPRLTSPYGGGAAGGGGRGVVRSVEWRQQNSGGRSPEEFSCPARSRAPPPAPSRAYTSWEEGTALAREGENYSIYLISKGAMVASGDRSSPTEAAAETLSPFENIR